MSNQDPDGFLLGGGGKSAKFENVGDTISGTVIGKEMRQQTDIGTGALLTWDNGEPKMQLVIKLQTDLREDAEDDGVRNLYVSGGFKRASLQKAVADAIRSAGAKTLEIGGTLAVKHTDVEAPTKKGFNGAKLYAAKYTPPTDAFLDTPKQPEPVAAAASGGGWDASSEPPF